MLMNTSSNSRRWVGIVMCDVPIVGLMATTNAYKGAIEALAIGGKIGSILTPSDAWKRTCN